MGLTKTSYFWCRFLRMDLALGYQISKGIPQNQYVQYFCLVSFSFCWVLLLGRWTIVLFDGLVKLQDYVYDRTCCRFMSNDLLVFNFVK